MTAPCCHVCGNELNLDGLNARQRKAACVCAACTRMDPEELRALLTTNHKESAVKHGTKRAIAILLGLLVVLGTAGCNRPEDGQIGVVRNGGMQDNNKIRSIQCPGSSAQWNGWGSDMHSYPASDQQRTFKFNDDEDADADPIRNLRTKDGYEITLNGTVYFKTSFDCSARGRALVKKFDQANFSRPDGQKPWEDWSGWLENQWKPILDSTARDVILSFAGKDVVAAIVLLSQNQEEKVDLTAEGQNNKSSVQRIESALKEGLVRNLKTKLGEDYFIDITFNMEQPRLASEIEKKIRTAQAAFGRVADARAERVRQEELVKVERQKRKVAFERSKGYANCPSCARQDELRSLPKNLNTLVLGSGSSISLGRGGR